VRWKRWWATLFCNILCGGAENVRDESGKMTKYARGGFALDPQGKLCYNKDDFVLGVISSEDYKGADPAHSKAVSPRT
jgi:hypothetical protein